MCLHFLINPNPHGLKKNSYIPPKKGYICSELEKGTTVHPTVVSYLCGSGKTNAKLL